MIQQTETGVTGKVLDVSSYELGGELYDTGRVDFSRGRPIKVISKTGAFSLLNKACKNPLLSTNLLLCDTIHHCHCQ
jgi:hypothetical protein